MTIERPRPVSPTATSSPGRLDLGGKLVVVMFTVVPLSGIAVTALAGAFTDVRIASFSLTAIVGALTGLGCWTLLALYGRVPAAAARVGAAFAMFGIAAAGSAVLGGLNREGIQFLQVLFSALGALLLAAAVRRSLGVDLDAVVSRCVRFTSVVLFAAALGSALGAAIDISPRTSAIVALIGLAWFIAEYRDGRRHALRWVLAMLIAVAVSLSRTALLAGFVIVAVSLIASTPRHRLRNVALAMLLVVAGYWAITSWSPLHDRFFQGDVSLSVGGLNVNAEGRTKVWGVLWSEVSDQLLLGHGVDAASARSFALDPAFDQPHSDYLRIIYDFGVVGSALLAWCSVLIARGLRRASPNGLLTPSARAALLAGLAILIVMATDNPLDYPFVMIPLGALIGIGIGSASSRQRPRSDGAAASGVTAETRVRDASGIRNPASWVSRSRP